jgi:hypothetical protein
MWYKAEDISKEEKKAKIAEFKAERKAQDEKDEAVEKARAEALKKLSKEEKAKMAADDKARQKAEKEKAAADAKAAKIKAKEDKAAEKAKLAAMTEDQKKEYLEKKKADKAAYVNAEFAKYKSEHAAKVAAKGESLSKRYDFGGRNKLFWFNVGQTRFCQGYMNWWRKLEIAHPVLAKWIYQLFYFIVFSEGVTIWQYLLLTFLPYLFGIGLAGTEFMWPSLLMGTYQGKQLLWNILGYEVLKNKAGEVIFGGGLGYFLSFEIATFTAQCINFPLQRNITFKSHGNPWWQAMWYFIGWVAISFLCNAFNGLWMPFGSIYMVPAVFNLLVMFCTGGISMIIFFFIFRIIFPAGEAKKDVLVGETPLEPENAGEEPADK